MVKSKKVVEAPISIACRTCLHWKVPDQEALRIANGLIELTGISNLVDASRQRMKLEAEKLLDGYCTFDPKWIETANDHYCGQWGKK